jgi:hypothetical protein
VARSLEDVDALAVASRGARIGMRRLRRTHPAFAPDVTGWSFSAEPGSGVYVPARPLGPDGAPESPQAGVSRAWARAGRRGDRQGGHDLKFTTIRAGARGVELKGRCSTRAWPAILVDATRSSHSIEGLAIERANYRPYPQKT